MTRIGEAGPGRGVSARTLPVAAGRRPLAAALFVLLVAAGAHAAVPVPWTPVPMTLQTLFVLLSGLMLGPSAGAASMAAYVAIGVGGVPVFAAGAAGPAVLVGPTGGFILAFPLASGLCGRLAGPRDAGVARLLTALAAGLLVVYLAGAAHLALLSGAAPVAVLRGVVLPFAPGDAVELLVALAVALRLRPRAPERT